MFGSFVGSAVVSEKTAQLISKFLWLGVGRLSAQYPFGVSWLGALWLVKRLQISLIGSRKTVRSISCFRRLRLGKLPAQ